MIRKRRYCTSNHWWIISNVQAIYVFLQTRWSVKTSIFLCHGIKRWYLREWSIMDTFLNTWYFISLHSNRFRFLVESGGEALETRESKKKNPRASCALSLFLLGGCGAYLEISVRRDKTCLEFSRSWGRLAWISSDYFESLLLPQLLRGENDSKQSDEFQARGRL